MYGVILSPSKHAGLIAAQVDDNFDDNLGSMKHPLIGQVGMDERRRASKISHRSTR